MSSQPDRPRVSYVGIYLSNLIRARLAELGLTEADLRSNIHGPPDLLKTMVGAKNESRTGRFGKWDITFRTRSAKAVLAIDIRPAPARGPQS